MNVYSTSLGILRFEMDSDWAVADFGHWLLEIERIYFRLSCFFIFSDRYTENLESPEKLISKDTLRQVDKVLRKLNQPFLEEDTSFFEEDKDKGTTRNLREAWIDRMNEQLVRELQESPPFLAPVEHIAFLIHPLIEAQGNTNDLRILRMQIASPGWIEVIGNLNPLKVLAEFISTWRHENTMRMQNDMQARLEQMKIQAEMLKILIENADSLKRRSSLDFISRFIVHTVEQPQQALALLANDKRIKSATLREESHDKIVE